MKNRKIISGKFSKDEMDALRQAVCEYAKENNLGVKDLEELIEDTTKNSGYNKAWTKISESLRKFYYFYVL